MSIPTKGSRPIHVAGHDYRWRIRRSPTYMEATNERSPMRVAVQSCTAGAKSVLVVNLRVTRPDNWISPHQTSITPGMVRDMIDRAVAGGWDPLGTISPTELDYGVIKDSVGL